MDKFLNGLVTGQKMRFSIKDFFSKCYQIYNFLRSHLLKKPSKEIFFVGVSIEEGVPKRSIPGPLLFLIYISDLFDDLLKNAKLFAGNTSLFYIMGDTNTSASHLNNDLRKTSN